MLLRKYFDKIVTKEDVLNMDIKNNTSKICDDCPRCVEVYKDEYHDLFTKNIYKTIQNPFWKEYVSDGYCDYSRSFHNHDKYIHVLKDDECRRIKHERSEIIKAVGEDFLYHKVCKLTNKPLDYVGVEKDCFVIDGTHPMRRPTGRIFYMDYKFIGDEFIQVEENKEQPNVSKLHDYTGIDVTVCYKILKECDNDYDKAVKYVENLIKENK